MIEYSELTLQVIISIVSVIICPILCAIFMYFGKKLWRKKEIDENKQLALSIGVQALLRDRLLQGCRYYQQQGYSTYNSRVNLTSMHEAYVNLGGNSIEIHEYERFMELPHKNGEQVE